MPETRLSGKRQHLEFEKAIVDCAEQHRKKKRVFRACSSANDESFVSSVHLPQYTSTLYMTNFDSANDCTVLKSKKIQTIISLGKSNRLAEKAVKRVQNYHCFDVEDCRVERVAQQLANEIFPQTRKILGEALRRGNVLVHCKQGVCRTPLVVFDFLLNYVGLSAEAAVAKVVPRRLCVRPGYVLLAALFHENLW